MLGVHVPSCSVAQGRIGWKWRKGFWCWRVSQELDIAVVKATNHVECPPKDKHVRSESSLLFPTGNWCTITMMLFISVSIIKIMNLLIGLIVNGMHDFWVLSRYIFGYICNEASSRCGILHSCACKENCQDTQLDGKCLLLWGHNPYDYLEFVYVDLPWLLSQWALHLYHHLLGIPLKLGTCLCLK